MSIQAQIINLFSDLRDDRGVTFLFISHDLGVVEHLCDDVAVMYLGQLVESASRDALFSRPLHPYTRALLAAVPTLDPHSEPQALVQGEIPDPTNPPAGCRFSSRCPQAGDRCRREAPALREVALAIEWPAIGSRPERGRRGLFISKQPVDCAQRRQDLLSAPSCETRYE